MQGSPLYWSIYDERFRFDFAFNTQTTVRLQYFQSLPLLSATNLTNFLTNRYPQLIRVATNTAAADFMKDDSEYQKGMTRLSEEAKKEWRPHCRDENFRHPGAPQSAEQAAIPPFTRCFPKPPGFHKFRTARGGPPTPIAKTARRPCWTN